MLCFTSAGLALFVLIYTELTRPKKFDALWLRAVNFSLKSKELPIMLALSILLISTLK